MAYSADYTGEPVKYEVLKNVTMSNYVPKGARLASRSKDFKKGEVLEGEMFVTPDTKQGGFKTKDGFFFPLDNKGKSEYIKPVSKTKEGLINTKKFFKSPEFAQDDDTIEGTIESLEKTRMMHVGIYAAGVGIGALIGLGAAVWTGKKGFAKGLFVGGGAVLVGVPTAIWLVPKTKEVNTKLKTLNEL